MFTKDEKLELRLVSRKPEDKLFGKDNERLNDLINKLKQTNPSAFLSHHDLLERNFYHKPLGITEFKSYIKESK